MTDGWRRSTSCESGNCGEIKVTSDGVLIRNSVEPTVIVGAHSDGVGGAGGRHQRRRVRMRTLATNVVEPFVLADADDAAVRAYVTRLWAEDWDSPEDAAADERPDP